MGLRSGISLNRWNRNGESPLKHITCFIQIIFILVCFPYRLKLEPVRVNILTQKFQAKGDLRP